MIDIFKKIDLYICEKLIDWLFQVSAAPTLQSLPQAGAIQETLDSWSSQLNQFESNLEEYSELIDDLGSASEQE